jgi:hypothetical protein
MEGKITRLSVTYVVQGSDDAAHILTLDLDDMRQHARAERVDDLLDDLAVICEDTAAGKLRKASR